MLGSSVHEGGKSRGGVLQYCLTRSDPYPRLDLSASGARRMLADQGYAELATAAKNLGVDELDMNEVLFWDGSDLSQLSDEGVRLSEDEIARPPEYVTEIYKRVTPSMRSLTLAPWDREILGNIKAQNVGIKRANQRRRETNVNLWTIGVEFFSPQYESALTNYAALRANPADAGAREGIATLKSLIDRAIERKHYLATWTIPTAESYIQADQTINRIVGHSADDHDGILGVAPGAPERDAVTSLRTLGTQIHPKFAMHAEAQNAFDSK